MTIQIPAAIYTSDALASLALIAVLFVSRLVAGRTLRRRENLPEQVARRWTANIRNVLILVAVVGLIMIWAPQLRTFALSLTAVAVAIVVATKELLLCLSGAALRTFTRAFSVGDIVEIGASKGEVIDLNLLAGRLIEFDQREGSIIPTGRTIILPYSLLFSSPAKVLPLGSSLPPHSIELTFEPDVHLFARRAEIEALVMQALHQWDGDQQPGFRISAAAHEARILFGTSDIGKQRVEIIVAGAPHRLQELENTIVCAIGSLLYSQEGAKETEPAKPEASHQR